MSAYYSYLNKLVNQNHKTFKDHQAINWLNTYMSEYYEEIRQNLLTGFSSKINWSFKNTKPWINQISKGCELCGNGEWSCIFITGRCNAKCFYCPAPQTNDDEPMAQQLNFETAEAYASFINYFDFKGVSFSGGEPFLVFDRLLEYLETIRRNCNPDIYIWLYTNGMLSSPEKFKKLVELGLNEVRFDIGATNYKLDYIKNAKGLIKNITVEIPLDPNKKEFIKSLLPELVESGVSNLNLHQLRMTKHNASNLLKNNFTYLHGEHPTVLESELAVLEVLSHADKTSSPLGINYCGFQYKNRFQKAAYRKRIVNKMTINEQITENGYILNIYADSSNLAFSDHLTVQQIIELINNKLVKKINISELIQNREYYNFVIIDFFGILLNNGNDQNISEPIIIGNSNYISEKGRPTLPIVIKKEKINNLVALLKDEDETKIPDDIDLFEVWRHLKIEKGFRQYF